MTALSGFQWLVLEALLATLLYGVYGVLFLASLYTFLRKEMTNGKGLLVVNILLFVSCTAQWACNFLEPLLLSEDPDEDPEYQLWMNAYVANVMIAVVYASNTASNVLADGLLIWRCYTIWGARRSIIVLPLLLLLGEAASGIVTFVPYAVGTQIGYDVGPEGHRPKQLIRKLNRIATRANTAYWATSFTINMMMTLLIGGRIWWITRDIDKLFGRSHKKGYIRAILIVVESGAVYSVLLLLSVVSTALVDGPFGQNAQNVLASISGQVVGIFPTAILVLVGLGLTSDNATNTDWLGSSFNRSMEFVPRRELDLQLPDEQTEEVLATNLELHVGNGAKSRTVNCNPTSSSNSNITEYKV
ncbi:hypothetical protein GLOTRDRAFT_111863 [Gloeophyllum trabeum ATCC 11539]|uniref:Uncharacterized protein n=1 Tax=Gloeophyllum trabeum (strain ATCC 11539 / FP-39264 / Madison 617) TaxID=670483 RepID=S7PZN3_GLOTA|nr:uncharacterized protein GLOTRDRAFT_111863 [Gloeophyllum trabeum ATCC 11539]EPQ53126.1 hypothetical protein GLOTRDRAFT_111863 [Gloeophyllum trabeum ATCC 11539]